MRIAKLVTEWGRFIDVSIELTSAARRCLWTPHPSFKKWQGGGLDSFFKFSEQCYFLMLNLKNVLAEPGTCGERLSLRRSALGQLFQATQRQILCLLRNPSWGQSDRGQRHPKCSVSSFAISCHRLPQWPWSSHKHQLSLQNQQAFTTTPWSDLSSYKDNYLAKFFF